MVNDEFKNRLNRVIPGGAHTYSRGDDQFPSNAPQILEKGIGAYVWSPDGTKYLDYGMALRAVTSVDGMTADWAHLPYEFLAHMSNSIINQVRGINRVVYDISSKPPATIEWE